MQQECLVHVERGLCAKLIYKHQAEAVMKMNRLGVVEAMGGIPLTAAARKNYARFLK